MNLQITKKWEITHNDLVFICKNASHTCNIYSINTFDDTLTEIDVFSFGDFTNDHTTRKEFLQAVEDHITMDCWVKIGGSNIDCIHYLVDLMGSEGSYEIAERMFEYLYYEAKSGVWIQYEQDGFYLIDESNRNDDEWFFNLWEELLEGI